MSAQPSLLFPPFRLELGNDQLWKKNKTVPLRRKTLAVLRYLVDHLGQLVTKEQVLAAVWRGTYVEEGALTICIAELRKALGDNTKTPRFIETVHGRGYRFIAKVVSSPTSLPIPDPRPPIPTLVGRESELAQLHVWLDKALSGERQIVFVTGEPGIGKTTLVDAFLQSLGSSVPRLASKDSRISSTAVQTLDPRHQTLDGGWWLSWGQCIEQYGPGEPFMPILEALGRLCRAPHGEHLVTLLGQHAPTWLVQLPTLLTGQDPRFL